MKNKLEKTLKKNLLVNKNIGFIQKRDERVKDYCKISHGNYIFKMIDDNEMEVEFKNYIPCHFTEVVVC